MTQPAKRQVTIEWDDIAPNLQAAATMTGLQYMQAITRGELAAPPMAYLMGGVLGEVEAGRVVFVAQAGEQHYNPMGVVHGGLAATLLDSAMGCAVHTTLPQGKLYTTSQLNIHLTRAIMPDVGELVCEGRVVHGGSRVATAEGTLKDRAGKLYAHGTTTCFIFPLSDLR